MSGPVFLSALFRKSGFELQVRFNCSRCALPVAYQTSTILSKSHPFIYILPGALTQIQGQIPKYAFELGPGGTNAAVNVEEGRG